MKLLPAICLTVLTSCGSADSELKIIGGRDATTEDLVSQSTVALTSTGQTFCSGTLIDPLHVLTAAHCLNSGRPFQITFGIDSRNQTSRSVASVLPHPDGYDIGIVRLASRAPRAAVPVDILPNSVALRPGQSILLAGFGQSALPNGPTGRLRLVTTVIDRVVPERKEIWFGPTPQRSACRGDSGGPMFIQATPQRSGTAQLYLLGSTIGGHRLPACSGSGKYADARAHRNWISATLNQ